MTPYRQLELRSTTHGVGTPNGEKENGRLPLLHHAGDVALVGSSHEQQWLVTMFQAHFRAAALSFSTRSIVSGKYKRQTFRSRGGNRSPSLEGGPACARLGRQLQIIFRYERRQELGTTGVKEYTGLTGMDGMTGNGRFIRMVTFGIRLV